MDFFNFSKPFHPIHVPGSQTEGFMKVDDDDDDDDYYNMESQPQSHLAEQSYVEEYRLQEKHELEKLAECEESCTDDHQSSGLNDVEVTSAGTFRDINDLQNEELTQVYSHYYGPTQKKPKASSAKLAIHTYKKNILSMIELNEVTVITGHTGCGKTTQVPQYILDSYAEKKKHCNIIVTQPRRIAAISIAKRVCDERGWENGRICGYKVGMNNMTSEDTRLTYMTVGVFLQMLVCAKDMNNFTHVILDEVHERDQDMDFALLVVKKLLNTNSRGVKVVLMSATVDAAKFASYFQKVFLGKFQPAPIIAIKQESNYQVKTYHLEELQSLGELPDIDEDEPYISDLAMDICVKLIKQFERIDSDSKNKNAVLVFLPGIHEIDELYNRLTDPKVHSPSNSIKYYWDVKPLHSTITIEEQRDVFRPPPSNHRKIILSTNIAESSITVSDVKFVIDFCLTKILKKDPGTNFTSLQLAWASKVNCVQRSGRVGRVMEGRVYRMVPKDFYETLEDEGLPEMLRCPLERVILRTKLLEMGEPKALLALALDPPDLSNIESTILMLKESGGLLVTCNGRPNPHDGDITYLGRLMAQLPVDIHITRLMIMGYIFSCLQDCIIMGAAMSLKSIFKTPFRERLDAYNSKLLWADGSCSDCIAFLNAYELWKTNCRDGFFQRSAGGNDLTWAKRHFIQLRTLKEVDQLVDELTRRLKQNLIEQPVGHGRVEWKGPEKALILKIAIAGAFYPNYFGRGSRGGQVDEQDAVKTLGGRDPYTTVYLQSYPNDQPKDLYSQLIKDGLAKCKENMKITYDGSCKVYIEFRDTAHKASVEEDFKNLNDRVPGRISMAVYRAVKIKQIQGFIEINVLPPQEAQKRAEKLGIKSRLAAFTKEEDFKESKLFPVKLPGIRLSTLRIRVVHKIDPGHFWVAEHDDINRESLVIHAMLNGRDGELPRLKREPQVGDFCAAPYRDDGEFRYYRARIDGVEDGSDRVIVQVFFIDYGNSELIVADDLRDFGPEIFNTISKIPCQALECVLTGIRPSLMYDSKGYWSEEAVEEFDKVTNGDLYGEIYSVVNGVISLELINVDPRNKLHKISVNRHLLQKGLAEPSDESYLSRRNNEIRETQKLDFEQREVYNAMQKEKKWSDCDYLEPPDKRECKMKLQLRGPNSPLEMKIYSYTRAGLSRQPRIAQDSVNSVLLDSYPEDPHERLIVSAHVSQNQTGSHLILHHTTIMPNIHGLSALLAFIFAPKIELRVNEQRTRYTGMLCGLGVDENGKPMFPEHDMEVNFDSEIDFDDFVNINRIRFQMSLLLLTDDDEVYPRHSFADIIKCQKCIEKSIIKLLKKRRPTQEIEYIRRSHMWGLVRQDLKPDSPALRNFGKRIIFPVHSGVSIDPEENEILALRENIQKLKNIDEKGSVVYSPQFCRLCKQTLETLNSLRAHLGTVTHKKREGELKVEVQ